MPTLTATPILNLPQPALNIRDAGTSTSGELPDKLPSNCLLPTASENEAIDMSEASTALPFTKLVPARGLSLRANFTWTFFGNAVSSACQWGGFVVLAKLGSPELVGQYALGLAVSMPVIMFASLQLRPVIASDVREEYRFGEYLGFRILTTILASLVILAIPVVLHDGLKMSLLIFLVGLSQATEAISDVYYARLQCIHRMDRIARSQILRGPLALLALGLGVYFTGELLWGVAAMIVARAAVLVGYDLRIQTQSSHPLSATADARAEFEHLRGVLRPRWDILKMRNILWVSFPLGLVALLLNLNTYIPRYFIQWSRGTRELGLFSAIAFLMTAGNLLVSALAQAVFVRFAESYAKGNRSDFISVLLKLLSIGTGLGASGVLVAWIAGPEILRIVYRPEYAEHSGLLVWFMLVAWISYLSQLLGTAITAARIFVHQIPLNAAVALAIAVGSYWLVPRMGLMGGVLAILIGCTVQLLGSVGLLLYGLKTKLECPPTGAQVEPS
jgi:O-antigen/teichoic acid export membrane protein